MDKRDVEFIIGGDVEKRTARALMEAAIRDGAGHRVGSVFVEAEQAAKTMEAAIDAGEPLRLAKRHAIRGDDDMPTVRRVAQAAGLDLAEFRVAQGEIEGDLKVYDEQTGEAIYQKAERDIRHPNLSTDDVISDVGISPIAVIEAPGMRM